MHDGQVGTSVELVRSLLAVEAPHLADLPIAPVPSFGTDHDIYRLGDDLAVRLPIVAWAAGQPRKEAAWLQVLAPHLPLRVPRTVHFGRPVAPYPFEWSVVEWLAGEPASSATVDQRRAAADLAGFVVALRACSTAAAPRRERGARGSPLAELNAPFQEALLRLGDRIDRAAASRVWAAALEAEVHIGPEVWVHGDLLPGNLITTDGGLVGVIDFGGLNVGDPACDLQPAWAVFDEIGRVAYREALDADDDSWARGRGWSLCQAVMALPYYWDTNPGIVSQARRSLAALGVESRGNSREIRSIQP